MPEPAADARIAAEFDDARRAGTAQALNMFIARHAGHPLAADATFLRDQILRRQGRPIPVGPEPMPRDPDLAVQEEFAATAAQGSPDAYRLFIARHPDHALAQEARRRLAAMRRP